MHLNFFIPLQNVSFFAVTTYQNQFSTFSSLSRHFQLEITQVLCIKEQKNQSLSSTLESDNQQPYFFVSNSFSITCRCLENTLPDMQQRVIYKPSIATGWPIINSQLLQIGGNQLPKKLGKDLRFRSLSSIFSLSLFDHNKVCNGKKGIFQSFLRSRNRIDGDFPVRPWFFLPLGPWLNRSLMHVANSSRHVYTVFCL